MDTVDEKVPKIGVELIKRDMDGNNTDTEANNDDNKIPGLDKNGENDSSVWESAPTSEQILRLPDSELIRRTQYGPVVAAFQLAHVI